MKRLLSQIGLTYLSVLAVVFYLGKTFAFYLGFVALVLSLIFISVKRCRKTVFLPVIAFVVFVACVVFIIYTNSVYDKTLQKYGSAEGEVVAKLVEEPVDYTSSKLYKLKAEEFDGKKCNFKFYIVNDADIDIEPFEKIKMRVEFQQSYNNNDKSNGYFLKVAGYKPIENYTVYKNEHRNLYYHAIKLRGKIRGLMNENLSEETANLCNALLIGDKYALSADIKDDFVRTGASHLIVVSGFHFSVLASVFYFLSQKLRGRRCFTFIPAVAFVIIYMLVTGCTPSVLRSAVMMIMCFLGLAILRDTDPLTSLSVAAIVVLIVFGPYSAGNLGLMLSFACTFSILEFSPKLKNKFLKRIKIEYINKEKRFNKFLYKNIVALVSAISVTVSAFVASFPISVIFFGGFSTMGVVSALVLSFPVQLLLVFSLLFGVFGFIPVLSVLIVVLKYPMELLSTFIISFTDFFSSLKFSYVLVEYNYVYLLIPLFVLLVVVMYFNKSRYRFSLTVIFLVLAFICGEISAIILNSDESERMNFYNIGDGIAVVYHNEDTDAVLMLDCSGEGRTYVVDKVSLYADDIDFYACTNNTSSAVRSMTSFAQSFAIDDILLYDNKRTINLPGTVNNILKTAMVHEVTISENVVAKYYMVGNSYVVYLSMYDKTMLILPYMSDAALLPENMRKADYIAINGMVDNTELLKCDTLIISADKEKSKRILKYMYGMYNNAYLTSDGDVNICLGGVD